MPTLNAPQGLKPFTPGGSGTNSLQTGLYWIPQSDTNVYKPYTAVRLLANADAKGTPGVIASTSGTEALVGSIVSIEPVNNGGVSMVGAPLSLELVSIPAVKLRDYYVYVANDPNQIFEVQGDATATNQIAANANKNAQLTINDAGGAPVSGTVINSATIATTQAHNIRLLGLSPTVITERQGFGAFSLFLCKINQHQLAANTAGV
jgi:hypothetical protein